MAKVTGPLFSLDARNAIGKAIVYSYWKGVNYVRSRVIPKNPKKDDQAEVRTYLGAVGKNSKAMGRATVALPVESALVTQVKLVTPADQSWTSYFAKTQIGSALAAIKAAITAYAALSTANKALWVTGAATVPLTGFDIGYGIIEPITGAEQLFISATAAFALGLEIAPSDPSDWGVTEITAYAAAYKATST